MTGDRLDGLHFCIPGAEFDDRGSIRGSGSRAQTGCPDHDPIAGLGRMSRHQEVAGHGMCVVLAKGIAP